MISTIVTNEEKGNTYSFWKKAIAGTQPPAIAQCDSTCGRPRLVVDNVLIAIVGDENFEPVHQIWVAADEVADLMHKNVLVDEVLREEVAELQELVHSRLVPNVLLHPVEECQLLRRSA